MRLKFFSAWKRPSKELHYIRNTLSTCGRIAGGTAKPHQETNVTANTVADGAKARQVDEKTLLKNGGQRIVKVSSFCESPKLLDDLGSLGCEPEEIGKNPESLLYAFFKSALFNVRCCTSHAFTHYPFLAAGFQIGFCLVPILFCTAIYIYREVQKS